MNQKEPLLTWKEIPALLCIYAVAQQFFGLALLFVDTFSVWIVTFAVTMAIMHWRPMWLKNYGGFTLVSVLLLLGGFAFMLTHPGGVFTITLLSSFIYFIGIVLVWVDQYDQEVKSIGIFLAILAVVTATLVEPIINGCLTRLC